MSMYSDEFADALPEDVPEPEPVAYQSPLMARLQGGAKLTLDLLATEVPVFQAGEAAKARLESGEKILKRERDKLAKEVLAGETAKETLVLAGIPLIKHLAKKEYARRRNWQSQVTYEDLVQEGSGGFIRGLRAYKVGGGQKSATNYLGQWVLTDMRRNVEAIDNDFGVSYDAAERFRKIRAIRSRLASTLGREPTDEEVLAAAADPLYRGGSKIGRVVKVSETPKRQLTQEQLDQERELRSRVGHTSRFGYATDTDEYTGPSPDQGRPISAEYGSTAPGDPEDIIEDGARLGLAKLLMETFNLMGLPLVQREVIARRFGLPPHEKEQTPRDICRDMSLHRDKVGQVVEAFTEQMSSRGGAFHRACGQWDPEDLADLGLGWTLTVLGRWSETGAATPVPLPEILTVPLTPRKSAVAPPADPPPNARTAQVNAQFVCDYHGWGFVGVYLKRADVPKTRACPQCGRESALLRVAAS